MKQLFSNLFATIKTWPNAIASWWQNFKNSYPHHGLRVTVALALFIYLGYLLICFLTIPIRDYYVDVYSVSKDAIKAEIDLTIGDKNVLNTHSNLGTLDRARDSISVKFTIYEYGDKQGAPNTKRQKYINMGLSKAVDSMAILSRLETNYWPVLRTYNPEEHYQHLECDTLSDYIYVHVYGNYYSSVPVGYIIRDKDKNFYPSGKSWSEEYDCFPTSVTLLNEQTGKRIRPINAGVASSHTIDSMNISIIKDSISYKRLSRNHAYVNRGLLYRYNSIGHNVSVMKDGKKADYLSYPIGFYSSSKPKRGLYKFFPLLGIILSKEDISNAYYQFSFNSEQINHYTINVHSRAGVVVENNPSDELQVLSLHDTQIIKSKYENGKRKTNYEDTDLFVKFPENNNIQALRLFFVSILMGWLLEVFFSNIDKLIKARKKKNL